MEYFVGESVNPLTPMVQKQKILAQHLNQSKYEFMGFVDRTTDVVLRPLFHNVRDTYGRFATVK